MHTVICLSLVVSWIAKVAVMGKHVTVPDVIKWNGYPFEEHHVTTEDGYILTLHRIPHGLVGTNRKNIRQPVIMQHGLLSSSASWVLNVTHKAPAYLMADAGYDVWLPNIRGNQYSKNHTHLSPTSKTFWQFSWDEMAQYDFPAFVDYILEETKQKKLFYIGHSMGTTIFFAGTSMRPEYNEKVEAMFALAPVGTVSFIHSWVAYFSYIQTQIEWLMDLVGDYEIVPNNSLVMKLVKSYCTLWWGNEYFCENLLFLIIGFDKNEFDESWMPVVIDELLSGTSLSTLLHFSQEYREGRFQHYDYGWFQNLQHYGQVAPPEYVMSKVTAPVHLIWGKNDYLADEQDVMFLVRHLPNVKSKFPVADKHFNHLDFLWSKYARKLVYDPILRIMSKRKCKHNETNSLMYYEIKF